MWHSNKEHRRKKKEDKPTKQQPVTEQTQDPFAEPSEHAGYTQSTDNFKPVANGIKTAHPKNHAHQQPNGNAATHTMNAHEHKAMTSPPGAPPSRPPPPRQESIEKYLRRSGSSEDRGLGGKG